MNAKELRDTYAKVGLAAIVGENGISPIILEALDLLAAVESSGDEIVRELRGQHCRDFGSDPQCDADGLCICAMHERAAAALVAMRAAKEKAEAERDSLKKIYEHAYRMTFGVDWNNGTHAKAHRAKLISAVDAYRAAQGKNP